MVRAHAPCGREPIEPVTRRVARAALAMLSALAATAALAADAQPPIQAFLAEHFQFGPAEYKDLDRREPIVRALHSADGREVATLGVIQLRVPASFYVEQLRDVVEFKKSAAVLKIGRFNDPATVEDVAAMTLDPEDVERLRACRPRACKVQLSSEALQRFQKEVPWKSPEASAVASRIMREVLVDAVNRYRQSGDAALMTYVDGDRPVSLAAEFAAMIATRPAFLERFPLLHRHVVEFPRRGDGVDDVIYWSKEKMGPATVLGVTHLAAARLTGQLPAAYAVATKQIYATHYFDSSLGVTVLLQDPQQESISSLVYVNRSRIDLLTGFWSGVKRPIVRSRVRAATEGHLTEARDLVERRYQARPQ